MLQGRGKFCLNTCLVPFWLFFLALWPFLKDPNLFTDPFSRWGPLPNPCRPGQEDAVLGTGWGARGWQGAGHCCVEYFVLWNRGQQPGAASEGVKGLDVIGIRAGSSEREF